LDTSPESAPAALADLIAAGLVSHEMIGDPGRLGGETEALKTLCDLVAGPVWRIEPYHYAFRAAPGDLGGTLGETAPEAQAAALEAALQAALGAEAVWVSATDLLPEAPALDAPLLLLRAQAEAVAGGLEAAGPELQAIIGARFAAAAARLAAGETGILAERLAAIEARQTALLAAVEAAAAQAARERADQAAAIERLAAAIGARDADQIAELAAFRETLGLTLAEFLADLERRSEAPMPVRVPQFS
jgi:hypothetical protein